jgi:hypothetical protein
MITKYTVENHEYVSEKSYEEVVAEFETALGDAENGKFTAVLNGAETARSGSAMNGDMSADFVRLAAKTARDSLANEPCSHRFEVIADEENPNVFYLNEVYAMSTPSTPTQAAPTSARSSPKPAPTPRARRGS